MACPLSSDLTAASSEVSVPTRMLGSLNLGSWPSTWARSAGLILHAQPAPCDKDVSRTCCVLIIESLKALLEGFRPAGRLVLFVSRWARTLDSYHPQKTPDRYGAKQSDQDSPERSAQYIKRIMRADIDPGISNQS